MADTGKEFDGSITSQWRLLWRCREEGCPRLVRVNCETTDEVGPPECPDGHGRMALDSQRWSIMHAFQVGQRFLSASRTVHQLRKKSPPAVPYSTVMIMVKYVGWLTGGGVRRLRDSVDRADYDDLVVRLEDAKSDLDCLAEPTFRHELANRSVLLSEVGDLDRIVMGDPRDRVAIKRVLAASGFPYDINATMRELLRLLSLVPLRWAWWSYAARRFTQLGESRSEVGEEGHGILLPVDVKIMEVLPGGRTLTERVISGEFSCRQTD